MAYRFAPSNTGELTLAGVRVAYFNYLLAKNANEKFFVRIDDTDLSRATKEYETQILKCLDWIGLEYTFLFRQSERTERYREVAELLLKNGFARKDGAAIRFTPQKEYLDTFNSWNDEISGEIKVSEEDKKIINDMVIYKSDGTCIYHFGSCIDDLDSGISTINRSMDHLSNTARQVALMDHINLVTGKYTKPKFQHVGLIFSNKKKMSKRDGASSMQQYIDNGYSPDAILNTVLRLGWSHSQSDYDKFNPIIPKEVAEKIFTTAGKMKASPANFDMAKLEWYNKKYTQQK